MNTSSPITNGTAPEQAANRAVEANAIQAEWMALSSDAPEKEKQRVFALMKKLPSSYISEAPNGLACLMIQGTPAHAFNEPAAACVLRAKRSGVQTALRWNTQGHWENAI